jgi:hypothetical protein
VDKSDGSIWLVILEGAKWVLGIVGSAVGVVGGYILRKYMKEKAKEDEALAADRAMLKRHEDLHRANAAEFTIQKTFREEVRKGPHGQALATRLMEIQQGQDKLHRRISSHGRSHESLRRVVVSIKRDLKWIGGIVERLEKKLDAKDE